MMFKILVCGVNSRRSQRSNKNSTEYIVSYNVVLYERYSCIILISRNLLLKDTV